MRRVDLGAESKDRDGGRGARQAGLGEVAGPEDPGDLPGSLVEPLPEQPLRKQTWSGELHDAEPGLDYGQRLHRRARAAVTAIAAASRPAPAAASGPCRWEANNCRLRSLDWASKLPCAV